MSQNPQDTYDQLAALYARMADTHELAGSVVVGVLNELSNYTAQQSEFITKLGHLAAAVQQPQSIQPEPEPVSLPPDDPTPAPRREMTPEERAEGLRRWREAVGREPPPLPESTQPIDGPLDLRSYGFGTRRG